MSGIATGSGTRSGLLRHDGTLAIVSAACPGERLQSERLTAIDPTTASS